MPRFTPFPTPAFPKGVLEFDDTPQQPPPAADAVACPGCGSRKPLAEYRAAGALACCPDRDALPGIDY